MPLDALTHLIHQFVFVILLVNVNRSCFVLKEKMSGYTRGGGGEGGRRNVNKCQQGEGGLKSVEKVSRIIWMAPYVQLYRFLQKIIIRVQICKVTYYNYNL